MNLFCPGLCGDDVIRLRPDDVTTNDDYHYWHQKCNCSTRKDKSRILDEFISITGHHRKHGIRLPGKTDAVGEKPPTFNDKRTYDETVREAAERICGKLLKAALPHMLESMERHGHIDLDPEVRLRLMAAGANGGAESR